MPKFLLFICCMLLFSRLAFSQEIALESLAREASTTAVRDKHKLPEKQQKHNAKTKLIDEPQKHDENIKLTDNNQQKQGANAKLSDKQPEHDENTTLKVVVEGLDDDALHENAEAFLEINQEETVKNPIYTEYLAKKGIDHIKESLKPYGYYLSEVKMDIKRSPQEWLVTYHVSLGKPVIAGIVDVSIEGEGRRLKEYRKLIIDYPIKMGDRLEQPKYKDFKGDTLALATTHGFFDGKFTRKQIVMGEDYQSASIGIIYDTGKRYKFGETTIKQDFLDDDVFERFITYKKGEPYASKAIADVQRDLYNSNYVEMVDVKADPNKTDKTVPVELNLKPKKNKKHTFAIGYATDTGARARYNFDWRWVNRRGHQFSSDVFVSEKFQEIGAEYRIPGTRPATDYYNMFVNFKNDSSGDLKSKLWNVGGTYHDKIGNWEREIGAKWQQEDFTVGNDSGDVGLLTPFASLSYRNVDDPLNITRGALLKGEVTGAHDALLSDVSFVQAVGEVKGIRKINKHKVKLSGGIGRTWVDDFHQLPASYRFFTGGDRTIRGYSFNSIGDSDSSGDNIGGDKMFYTNAEYEYFFTETMAGAAFLDAGDAYSSSKPSTKVGAGLGFHYYSPIGPIRVDVAHGFDDKDGDNVRLHLNIGPEF